jgi:hypothetical protein
MIPQCHRASLAPRTACVRAGDQRPLSARRALSLATTAVLALIMVAVAPGTAAAAAGVDPSTIELSLDPGQSATVATKVTTPEVAPRPDIILLGDTTGGMDPALANVRNNIRNIMDRVRASQPDARFGVAEYKEQRDGPRVFRVNTPLTNDDAAVADGTHRWLYDVGGGGAPWTDFINAHYRIATDAFAFRPNSTRVVAWFGDAASHDPSLGHTLADANNALRGAGIQVVAVPVVGTSGDGLDRLGQATSITSAAGGRLMPNADARQVPQALLDGITSLNLTVTPNVTSCDAELTASFDAASRTVRGGIDANFDVTFGVRSDAARGEYSCSIDYLVNGVSTGFVQTATITARPAARPGLSVGDVSVGEGDSGSTPATFTVTLDEPATEPVTVQAATADGTATSPADFTAQSSTEIFAPGQTSKSVTVDVQGDTIDESDETFTVELSNATNADIADSSGVGTIIDDDEPGPGPDPEPGNQPPVAEDATVAGTEGRSVDVHVEASDPDDDELSYTVTGQPAHGTLDGDGPDYTYTPEFGFTGTDEFTVEVCDPSDACDSATVTIEVAKFEPPAEPPADAGELTVEPPTAEAGDVVSISGSGYESGETVFLVLYSDSHRLGAIPADADGKLVATATIPEDTQPGAHQVVGYGEKQSLAGPLTITGDPDDPANPGDGDPGTGGTGGQSPGGTGTAGTSGKTGGLSTGGDKKGLALTGSDVLPLAAGGLALLLIGAFGLLAARRTRRRHALTDAEGELDD